MLEQAGRATWEWFIDGADHLTSVALSAVLAFEVICLTLLVKLFLGIVDPIDHPNVDFTDLIRTSEALASRVAAISMGENPKA